MDPKISSDLTPIRIHAYDDRDAEGRKLALVYACRVKWDDLQSTENPQVKYCSNCSQPVFAVSDVNDYHHAVAASRCIMVKPPESAHMTLGIAIYDLAPSSGLKWDDDV